MKNLMNIFYYILFDIYLFNIDFRKLIWYYFMCFNLIIDIIIIYILTKLNKILNIYKGKLEKKWKKLYIFWYINILIIIY